MISTPCNITSLFKPPKLLFQLLFFHNWTIAIPSFPDAPSTFINRIQKVQNNAAHRTLKAPNTDHINLIFTLCTGFQLTLESNTNFVLFVLLLSLLLVLSIFLIYSRFTHPLGNSDLLQTSIYCTYHLSTLSYMVIDWAQSTT